MPDEPYVDPSYDSEDGDVPDTAASTDPASGNCTGTILVQTEDDQLSVRHGSRENPYTGSVLDNDSSGDPCVLLAASLALAPSNGVVALSADGQFTYTPHPGFVGTDSFTYSAEDDQASSSALGTVWVIVNNDAPVACDDPYQVTADQDHDCYSVAGDPNLADNELSDPFDSPFDEFDLFADAVTEPGYPVWNDGNLQVPVVEDVGVAEQGDFFANVVGNDVDEDPLAASVGCEPHFGRLGLQPDGSFAYDADPWFIGQDSFSYSITDGAASDSAEVRLDVHGTAAPILASATEAFAPAEPFRLARFEERKCDHAAIADSIVYLLDAARSDDETHVFALEYLDEGEMVREEIVFDVASNFYADGAGRVYRPETPPTVGWYTDGALRYLRPEGSQLRFVDLHIEALIHWGDGATTETEAVGQVSLAPVAAGDPSSGFHVAGFAEIKAFHTYPAAGDFFPTVEYWPSWTERSVAYLEHHRRSAGTVFYERWPSASSHVEIDVANAELAVDSMNVAADEATAFTTSVGSFSDANTLDVASSYAATIAWGDGQTSSGVVHGDDGTFTVEGTHTYDVFGSYAFSVTVTDKDGYSASASGTATIADVLPVAADDSYTTSHGHPLIVTASRGVLVNDEEGNLGALTAVVSDLPAHGSLVLEANGGFTYTPSGAFVGQDTFTYVATDGGESSEAATVTITVTNDAPTAVDDAGTLVHDRVLVFDTLWNDTDPDGDALFAEVADPPSHGTASIVEGQLRYAPAAGFVGMDSVTYRAYDAFFADAFATLTIEVTNEIPVAATDTFSLAHDRSVNLNVQENDGDADDDVLTPVISAAPLHGLTTVLPDGYIAYDPAPGFVGSDSFEYYVNDGAADSSPVTVSLNVINTAPILEPDDFTVAHGATLSGNVLANDGDPEADVLAVALATDAMHGQLTLGTAGNFTYRPEPGFYGDDSFTYTASDGLISVGPVVVSIAVENHAPPATDLHGILLHDRQISWDLAADVVDPEGDTFSVSIISSPDNGIIAAVQESTFTYTPSSGYVGADSFEYQLCDDLGLCSDATVTISVTNQPPVAVADSYEVRPNTTKDLHLLSNDNDADEDSLTVVIETGPTHGTATVLADGRVGYEPTPGYAGPDSFFYYVHDLAETSATVVVNIDVANEVPAGIPDSFSGVHSRTIAGNVTANDSDVDDDPLSVTLDENALHGQLSLSSNGGFSYEPDSRFVGTDSFSYFVTDGVATVGPIVVTISVTNAAPVVSDASVSTGHHTPVTFGAVRGDADGDALQLRVTAAPQSGTVILNSNGTFTYTPDSGFVGVDEFQYVADDGIATSVPGIVSITVTNDAAVAIDDAYSVSRATEITVDLRDNDLNPDDDTLHVVNVTAPGSGSAVVLVGGSLRYTPNPGFFGLTSFTYQLFDGAAYSNTATVTLDVSPLLLEAPPLPLETLEQETLHLPLATFSSLDTSLNAGDYAAVIDWGDGRRSSGVVADFEIGEGESSTPVKAFAVTGSHQYLRDGTYVARLTITAPSGKSVAVEVPVHVANSLFAINAIPLPDLVVGEDAEDTLIDLRDYFQPSVRETLRFSATSSDPSLVSIASAQSQSAADLQGAALVLAYRPDQFGSAEITVTIESGEPNQASISDSFQVVVESVNDWPTATGTLALTVVEGGTVASPLQQLFHDLETPAGGLKITGPHVTEGGMFEFTASEVLGHTPAPIEVVVRAEDDEGGAAATLVTVSRVPVDDAPYFTDALFHPFVDVTYSTPDAVVTYLHGAHPSAPRDFFADEEDQHLSLSVTNTNASVFAVAPHIDNGYLFYKIVEDEAYFGTSDITIVATDSSGQTDSTTFTVTADHPVAPDSPSLSHIDGCDATQSPLEVEVSFSLVGDANGTLIHTGTDPSFVQGTVSVLHQGWFEGQLELQFDSNLGAVVGFKEMFGRHQHWSSPQPSLGTEPEAYRDLETEGGWRFQGRRVGASERFYVDSEHPSVNVLLGLENVNAVGTFAATFDGLANTYVPAVTTPVVTDSAGQVITLPSVSTFCATGPMVSTVVSESVRAQTSEVPKIPMITELNTVSVYASDAYAAETDDSQTPDPASFTFSRNDHGDFLGALDVYYRLNLPAGAEHAVDPLVDFANRDFGIGAPGSDEAIIIDPHTLIGRVTFPQGSTSATVTLYPRDDTTIEWDERVELELLPYGLHESLIHKAEGMSFSSFGRSYRVGPAATAFATILDNDGMSSLIDLDSSVTDAVSTFQGLPPTLAVPLGDFMPKYSQSDWTPIAEAVLQLPSAGGPPSGLSAEVTIAGVTGPTTSLDLTGVSSFLAENPAGSVRLSLLGPSGLESLLPTGAYDYDIRLIAGQKTRTLRGAMAGVNRSNTLVGESALGSGWLVDGARRIVATDSITPPPALATQHGSRLTSEGANAATMFGLVKADSSTIWFEAQPHLASVNSPQEFSDDEAWHHSHLTGAGLSGESEWAAWRYNGIQPGTLVQLFTTWSPGIDRAANAAYTVTGAKPFGGNQTSTTVFVDQRQQPNSHVKEGTAWRSLGFYVAGSDTLEIELNTRSATGVFANGLVHAASLAMVTSWQSTSAFETEINLQHQLGNLPFVVEDKSGNRSQFDNNGQLVHTNLRDGNEIEYTYADANGDGLAVELGTISQKRGLTIRYVYDTSGRLDKVVDSAGRETDFTIVAGNVQSIALPDPGNGQLRPVWHFDYNGPAGYLDKITDANGNITTITRAQIDHRLAEIELEDPVTSETWDWEVTPLIVDGIRGHSSPLVLAAVSGRIGNLEAASPTLREPRETFIDARDNEWVSQRDRLGNLTAQASPATASTRSTDTTLTPSQRERFGENVWWWERNEVGLVTKAIRPAGGGGDVPLPDIATWYLYDEHNDLRDVLYMDGSKEHWDYDPQLHEVVRHVDQEGRTTEFQLVGRYPQFAIERNPDGEDRVTSFVYIDGQLTLTVFASGTSEATATKIEYYETGSSAGLQHRVYSAYGSAAQSFVEYTYDPFRNPHQVKDELGRVTTTQFDALDQLVKLIQPAPGTGQHGAPTTIFQYDPMGNLRFVTDPRTATTEHRYDAMKQRRKTLLPIPGGAPATPASSFVTEYQYDKNGNMRREVEHLDGDHGSVGPDDRVTIYDYDARNLLQVRTLPDPYPTGAPHAALPSTVVTEVTQLARIEYRYDTNDNLRFQTDPRGLTDTSGALIKTTYEYDTASRLTRIVQPPSSEDWDKPGADNKPIGHASPTTAYHYYADGEVKRIDTSYGFGSTLDVASTSFTYDGLGRLESKLMPADAHGRRLETQYEYDARDNLISTAVDPGGLNIVTKKHYDKLDRLIAVENPLDSKTGEYLLELYAYNDANELERELAFGERFDASAYLLAEQGGGYSTTVAHLDATKNVVESSGVMSRARAYAYDDLGRLITKTAPDPDGLGPEAPVHTTFVYDENDNQRNTTVWFMEEVAGIPTLHALTSEVEYDALNRPWHTLGPANENGVRPEEMVAFNLDGTVQSARTKNVLPGQTDLSATWSVTQFGYDHAGRRNSTTHAQLPPSFSFADAAGNAVAQISSKGQLTTNAYDLLGRRVLTTTVLQTSYGQTSPVSTTATYRYFADGKLRTQFDSLNGEAARTERQVDALGNVTSTIKHLPGKSPKVHATKYDVLGRREELTANGDVTLYAYDDLGRLARETLVGLDLTRSNRYDIFGNLTQHIDRNGRTIQYAYDNAGQVTSETWFETAHLPGASLPDVILPGAGITDVYRADFTYTALGELKSAQDQHRDASLPYNAPAFSPNSSYGFSYDARRQPDLVTQSIRGIDSQFTLDYSHDLLGRVAQREVLRDGANLFGTSYQYDLLGRLEAVSQSAANGNPEMAADLSVDYVYAGLQLTDIYRYDVELVPTTPTGTHVSKTAFTYTNDGFVGTIQHEGIDVPHYIRLHAYDYDESGRVTRYISRTNPSGPLADEQNYSFDSLRQLTSTSDDGKNLQASFQYDVNGNQTTQIVSHNRIEQDLANRYRYDAEGNVTHRWTFEEDVAHSFVANNWTVFQANLSSSKVVLSTTAVDTPPQLIEPGEYRLQIGSLTVDAQVSFTGTVTVVPSLLDASGLPVVDNAGNPVLPSTSIPLSLTQVGTTKYRTASTTIDVSLPETVQGGTIRLTLSLAAGSTTPEVTYTGKVSLLGPDKLHVYEWDYHNRLTKVYIETDANSSQYNWTDSDFAAHSWDTELSFAYDVLGNRTGMRHDELISGSSISDQEIFYVAEHGMPLLLFDEFGVLTGHHVYGNGQLLAVDSIANDEVVWALADRQGTVRDLYSADSDKSLPPQGAPSDSTARLQRLKYDVFGAPTNNSNSANQLSSVVHAGYLGMTWAHHVGVYFKGQQVYEPFAGRLLSPSRAAELVGANAYVFAGNSPVDRTSNGRPAEFNANSTVDYEGPGYSYYVNPMNDFRAGRYGYAIAKSIGWLAFAGGTAGAGVAAGGTTAAGTFTWGAAGKYLAAQGALAAAETSLEAAIVGEDYNWLAGLGKNMYVNGATGGIGASLKWGGKTGAFLARQGVEIFGDTAIDVGVHGQAAGSALLRNTVGSIGGELTVLGIGHSFKSALSRRAQLADGFCFVAGTRVHSQTKTAGAWYALALVPPALALVIDVGREIRLKQRNRRQQAFESWYEGIVSEESFDTLTSGWDNDQTKSKSEHRDRLFRAGDDFWQPAHAAITSELMPVASTVAPSPPWRERGCK